jgi:hypothetical protein
MPNRRHDIPALANLHRRGTGQVVTDEDPHVLGRLLGARTTDEELISIHIGYDPDADRCRDDRSLLRQTLAEA